MMSHARAPVVLTAAAVGLSFACAESTAPPARDREDPPTPPGVNRDLSPLAGTYVETRDAGVSYILGGGGTFVYRIQTSEAVYDLGGTWVRADSLIGLKFDYGSYLGGWTSTAKVRGDSLFLDHGVDAERVGFVGWMFVRVRKP